MPQHSKREHWHPPLYEKADIRAVQALAQGNASETDQKRALDWIINTAAGTYDEPFRPGSQDAVNYMLGRRSVGLALVKLLKLKPDSF
jgi:uncharacterized UBP type Zn finger protein